MSDLVYNLENVFSTNARNGVLGQNKVVGYYIPSYQRGYKWASSGENPHVLFLIQDLVEAYEHDEPEYYLQYVTVKKVIHQGLGYLEVIDGQQRLTTLSLMLNAMAYLEDQTVCCISNDKLVYGVRKKVAEFLSRFVGEDLNEVLALDWKNFAIQFPEWNLQDIFYMHAALNKLHSELNTRFPKVENLLKFKAFVLSRVKIILNLMDVHSKSERAYRDLNSNKVELEDSELVKGLLLTQVPRNAERNGKPLDFRELMQLRAVLGRQWEDMARWVNQVSVGGFYFPKETNKVAALLQLIALKLNYGGKQIAFDDRIALFNFFHKAIKKEKRIGKVAFDQLMETYRSLNDWFEDDLLYNHLGYLFETLNRTEALRLVCSLLDLPKPEMKSKLSIRTKEAISIEVPIEELNFHDDKSRIKNLLLAVNVLGEKNRFDFVRYRAERWSLEHVFPQNPSEIGKNLEKEDLYLIRQIIKGKPKSFDPKFLMIKDEDENAFLATWKLFKEKLEKRSCQLNDRELLLLTEYLRPAKLDSIGNLALLSQKDNSSVSNGMFLSKRNRIIARIGKGSFVPQHTFKLFSKLLSDKMNPDLSVWSQEDIEAHMEWFKAKIRELKKSGTD